MYVCLLCAFFGTRHPRWWGTVLDREAGTHQYHENWWWGKVQFNKILLLLFVWRNTSASVCCNDKSTVCPAGLNFTVSLLREQIKWISFCCLLFSKKNMLVCSFLRPNDAELLYLIFVHADGAVLLYKITVVIITIRRHEKHAWCLQFLSLSPPQYPLQDDVQSRPLPFAASQCCECACPCCSRPLDGANSPP